MSEATDQSFQSPDLARAAERTFGDQSPPLRVEIKYGTQVSRFVRVIEEAHRRAGTSHKRFGHG